MSIPAENIKQLMQDLRSAAKSGNTIEIASILQMEDVQQLLKNETLVACAHDNLKEDNPFYAIKYAFYDAVDHKHLPVAKLLAAIIPVDNPKYPSRLCNFKLLFSKITKHLLDNLEMVKFFLTLPHIIHSIGHEDMLKLLVQAKAGNHLDIIECLLKIGDGGHKLYCMLQPGRAGQCDQVYMHVVTEQKHVEIAYCIAEAINTAGLDSKRLSINRLTVLDLNKIFMNIHGQTISISTVLQTHEQPSISLTNKTLAPHMTSCLIKLVNEYAGYHLSNDSLALQPTSTATPIYPVILSRTLRPSKTIGDIIHTEIINMVMGVLTQNKEMAEAATTSIVETVTTHRQQLSASEIQNIRKALNTLEKNPEQLDAIFQSDILQRVKCCKEALDLKFSNAKSTPG